MALREEEIRTALAFIWGSSQELLFFTLLDLSFEVLSLFGSKLQSKSKAIHSGLPILPSSTVDIQSIRQLISEVGMPIMLKATKGGGGLGMREVFNERDLEQSYLQCVSESEKAFGSKEVILC